jgi:phosphatidylglycerophosphate synthase
MRRPGLLNAPNVISLSRLALAACFVAFESKQARLSLLAAALLTDGLDGWLARRSQTFSRLGALIDAIADRAFVLTAVVTLVLTGALTLGESLVLVSRDIATVLGFFVARLVPWLRGVTFKARLAGKTVTILQFVVLAAAIATPSLVTILLVVVAVLSVIAIADYTVALWRGRTRI